MFKEVFKLLFGKKSLEQKKKISDLNYKRWQEEKIILEQKQKIVEEKHDLKAKTWKIRLPFAKMLAIFLFVNFTTLEIFTIWVTVKTFTLAYAVSIMPDFAPLLALLGAVIGQTLSYWIYSSKAKAENTIGGITYDLAMKDFEQQKNNFVDDQSVG